MKFVDAMIEAARLQNWIGRRLRDFGVLITIAVLVGILYAADRSTAGVDPAYLWVFG